VQSAKLSDKYKIPLVNLYHANGDPHLVIRLPEIKDDDTASTKSLECILTLLHYATGVAVDKMTYVMDPELGDSFHMERAHIDMIEALTSSSALPSGTFVGEVITLGSFKMNLPGILYALWFLSKKQGLLRPASRKGKEEVLSVTATQLRDIFNKRMGLVDKSKSYSAMLIKSALACITSLSNKRFPGGWVVSTRQLNNVKGDNGIIFKLGYTELLPYHHKLVAILENDTIVTEAGVLKTRSRKDEKIHKNFSFLEFRSALSLTCPKLDNTQTMTQESQAKTDPLTVKSEVVVNNFRNIKYYKSIDKLNRAHAMLQTIGQPKSKTKAIHYQIARNEFLHSTSKLPIKDGRGNEYPTIRQVSKPLLDYQMKLFRHQLGTKRSAEEIASSEDEMEVDTTSSKVAATSEGASAGVNLRSGSVVKAATHAKHGKANQPGSRQKKGTK
jgi:hypothetical protein